MTTQPPPPPDPVHLWRRIRGVETLIGSTARRLCVGVHVVPLADEQLTRAQELVVEARLLMDTDSSAAAARLEEARERAAAASAAAQENLPRAEPPPSHAQRAWDREWREFTEADGGEGLLGRLFRWLEG